MLQSRDAIYNDSIIVKFDEITDNGLNILISNFKPTHIIILTSNTFIE